MTSAHPTIIRDVRLPPAVVLLLALLVPACDRSPSPVPATHSQPGASRAAVADAPTGHVTGRVVKGGAPMIPIADAFVHVDDGPGAESFPVPSAPVVLDQVAFEFVPRVLGVMVGQTLRVRSSDDSPHNVHARPTRDPEFNVTLTRGEHIDLVFRAPEVMVPILCDIHPTMRAFVGVVTHPFFAVTTADGTFALRSLRPGSYRIAAWAETLGVRRTTVQVRSDATVHVVIAYE